MKWSKAQLILCGGNMARKKLEELLAKRQPDRADSLHYAISAKPVLFKDDPRTRIKLGG